MSAHSALDSNLVAAWLERHHKAVVRDLEPLAGGHWSTAYAYRLGTEQLVLRLAEDSAGFDMDADAMRFAHALPVPEVYARGRALDRCFAISRRHFGTPLEKTPADQAGALLPTLLDLLARLRGMTVGGDAVYWSPAAGPSPPSWRAHLRAGLSGRGDDDWLADLERKDPELRGLFDACAARVEALLPACPERRDLVHGDLLHQNVLVAPDARSVTGIFSWKCSVLGDALYDVAWCAFWGELYPGILTGEIVSAAQRVYAGEDITHRLLCYQLQIAASHMRWFLRTDDDENLQWVAAAARRLLSQ